MYPLHFINDHIFLEIDGHKWLFDTGAPESFGCVSNLTLAGKEFELPNGYMGLTAESLSGFVDVDCAGLLGANVLNEFDFLLDHPNQTAEVSADGLELEGHAIPLEQFTGIPIVTVQIDGTDHRFFFDTGAQISYFQDDSLGSYESLGSFQDFYPGVGEFETEIHKVPISINGRTEEFRCGTLPGILGMTLMMAGTNGILGNQVSKDRKWGYFPKRKRLKV